MKDKMSLYNKYKIVYRGQSQHYLINILTACAWINIDMHYFTNIS